MAKSSFEKVLEKKQKEAKRMADKQQREARSIAEKEAIRQRASAIVNGQQLVGGMRIMDASAEEVFKIILSKYDGNEDRHIYSSTDVFPKAYESSLRLEFEKLNMYGMITSPCVWVNAAWEVYLTPQGLSYFEDKEKAEEKAANASHINKFHSSKEYDVFISHANKDKSEYVDLLYTCLRKLGIRIFYDTDVISWGDNWKQVILNGTEKSEFAIIVISENFFDREWTERELNEFLKRQNEDGQKIILPLLYNITVDQFKAQYPDLEEIQAIETEKYSKEEIVILFARELIKRYKGIS